MIDCACRRTADLCDRCRDALFMMLKGVAARRGEVLGEQLAKRRPAPSQGEIEHAVRDRVADLAGDRELRALLAREAMRWVSVPKNDR